MVEQHAPARDAVEVGRLYRLVATDSSMWPGPVVGHEEDDIRAVALRVRSELDGFVPLPDDDLFTEIALGSFDQKSVPDGGVAQQGSPRFDYAGLPALANFGQPVDRECLVALIAEAQLGSRVFLHEARRFRQGCPQLFAELREPTFLVSLCC